MTTKPLNHRDLKIGIYTSPQCDEGVTFEQYVIENETDLKAWLKALDPPKYVKNVMGKDMLRALTEGHIIIATDENRLSGFPTYCFETTDPANQHPSSHHRVKLLSK